MPENKNDPHDGGKWRIGEEGRGPVTDKSEKEIAEEITRRGRRLTSELVEERGAERVHDDQGECGRRDDPARRGSRTKRNIPIGTESRETMRYL